MTTAEAFVEQAQALMEPGRNVLSAEKMARYMKGRFHFLGPRTADQPLMRPWLVEVRPQASEKLLLDLAGRLWNLPEREYQYLAGDLLDRYSKCLTPASLPALRALLLRKASWDSVDQLTGRVIGPLVLRHPELRPQMDRWSGSLDFWLRRASIIHQLAYGECTDVERLFQYCERNARDPEFFVRKAIDGGRGHRRVSPALPLNRGK